MHKSSSSRKSSRRIQSSQHRQYTQPSAKTRKTSVLTSIESLPTHGSSINTIRTPSFQSSRQISSTSTAISKRATGASMAVATRQNLQFSTNAQTASRNPIIPVTNILCHPTSRSFDDVNDRDQDDPMASAPLYTFKFYKKDQSYQDAPQSLTFGGHESLLTVAKQLQKTLPGNPVFISFSSADPSFKQHYAPPSHPYDPRQARLYKGGLERIKEAVAQHTGQWASGIPPSRVDFQSLRGPIAGVRFFFKAKETSIPDTLGLTFKPGKKKPKNADTKPSTPTPTSNTDTPKQKPAPTPTTNQTSQPAGKISEFTLPQHHHTPFHFESSLFDLTRAKNPMVQVTYSTKDLEKPETIELRQLLEDKTVSHVQYPSLDPHLVTVFYHLTDGRPIDPTGQVIGKERIVLPLLLVAFLGVKVLNYYLEQKHGIPQAEVILQDIDDYVKSSDVIIEQANQIRRDLYQTPFMERVSNYAAGKIPFKHVFNSMYKLHDQGEILAIPRQKTLLTEAELQQWMQKKEESKALAAATMSDGGGTGVPESILSSTSIAEIGENDHDNVSEIQKH